MGLVNKWDQIKYLAFISHMTLFWFSIHFVFVFEVRLGLFQIYYRKLTYVPQDDLVLLKLKLVNIHKKILQWEV